MPSRLCKSLALSLLFSQGSVSAADDAAFTAWKDALSYEDFETLFDNNGKQDTTLVYKDDDPLYSGTAYLSSDYEVTGTDPDLNA